MESWYGWGEPFTRMAWRESGTIISFYSSCRQIDSYKMLFFLFNVFSWRLDGEGRSRGFSLSVTLPQKEEEGLVTHDGYSAHIVYESVPCEEAGVSEHIFQLI